MCQVYVEAASAVAAVAWAAVAVPLQLAVAARAGVIE